MLRGVRSQMVRIFFLLKLFTFGHGFASVSLSIVGRESKTFFYLNFSDFLNIEMH